MLLSKKRNTGFTLLELVLVLSILAIASGFAVPNFANWSDRSKQKTIVNEIHTAFSLARWTAATHRSNVTLCPLSSANECIDDWHREISVFLDANNDKRPDSGEILRVVSPRIDGFTLFSRTAGRGYFQFDDRGMNHGALGSLVLCPENVESGAMTYMAVNMGGRFRSETDKDADGSIRLPWGTIVKC